MYTIQTIVSQMNEISNQKSKNHRYPTPFKILNTMTTIAENLNNVRM